MIELHDSKVESVVERDGSIVVEIAAYMHQSNGRPGIDAGTGWTQRIRLTFQNAIAHGTLAQPVNKILDGVLTLSGEQFENCFVVPLTHVGPTCLLLEFSNDLALTFTANGFQAECLGRPAFLERFAP